MVSTMRGDGGHNDCKGKGRSWLISRGEDNKRGDRTTAVDGGEGAVDDASNVHELFGRRPDKKGGTIVECKQPGRRAFNSVV